MAKLTVENRPVQKIVNEQCYILELSLEEALVLRTLTGKVFGCGEVRKITDKIYNVLDGAKRLYDISTLGRPIFKNCVELHENADLHLKTILENC